MADSDDIAAAVTTNATGPKSVTADGQSVSQHNLNEQIQAANFAASQVAKTKPHFGLRFTKLTYGGRS